MKVYIDQALSLHERLATLEGWFLEGWEEFAATMGGELPDPADYLHEAAALVAARLEDGCWVVPGPALYGLAALLALEESGWVEPYTLREDAVRPLLRDAKIMSEDDEYYYLVYSSSDEEE